MSEANLERLVSKLGKMRGAALKLGQFMSIQGMRRATTRLDSATPRHPLFMCPECELMIRTAATRYETAAASA